MLISTGMLLLRKLISVAFSQRDESPRSWSMDYLSCPSSLPTAQILFGLSTFLFQLDPQARFLWMSPGSTSSWPTDSLSLISLTLVSIIYSRDAKSREQSCSKALPWLSTPHSLQLPEPPCYLYLALQSNGREFIPSSQPWVRAPTAPTALVLHGGKNHTGSALGNTSTGKAFPQ